MTLSLTLDYYTRWGESLALQLETAQGQSLHPLHTTDGRLWQLVLELASTSLRYHFVLLGSEGEVLRREAEDHLLELEGKEGSKLCLRSCWRDRPSERMRYSRAIRVLASEPAPSPLVSAEADRPLVTFVVEAPALAPTTELCLAGSAAALGGWQPEAALPLQYLGKGRWGLSLDPSLITSEAGAPSAYKYLLRSALDAPLWEEGPDRQLPLADLTAAKPLYLEDGLLRIPLEAPRLAGCVVPLFSLRSPSDWGVGDMQALHEAIDAVAELDMHALQLLPMNDTTFYRDARDSYPYNAISVDALHPIYLSIERLPRLADSALESELREEATRLRALPALDYPAVLQLKERYLRALFAERAAADLTSPSYQDFARRSARWLEAYSYYSLLRDRHPGLPPSAWTGYERYDAERLHSALSTEQAELDYYKWLQYLLDEQLRTVRQHAEERGVFLKGDLPIGVAPHGLDVWLAPEYFHLEESAGAPPDDFAADGQNWGFPTYDWERMQRDGYRWWQQRLEGLEQYFHAFRIDHVLGFFRIWEIPRSQRSGLLGHFHPALPYSLEEWRGLLPTPYPIELLTAPLLHRSDLEKALGGERLQHFLSSGKLLPTSLSEYYTLSSGEQQAFDEEGLELLLPLCTETALIADPYRPGHYHPRISWERSRLWQHWSPELQAAWASLSHEYYYQRHNALFQHTALERLSGLIRHTDMLLCAEDLGMIPATVPAVLQELQIASLELERMPKVLTASGWISPAHFPCHSVATTSTHDMPPLRAWWHSLGADRQTAYLQEELGLSPLELAELDEAGIYRAIVEAHLASPAQLALLPLADWTATDERLWLQRPEEEQINHPEDPHQYWRYRFPIALSELVSQQPDWCSYIRHIIHSASRIPTL
ncbi:4-alpha-glucanotransferase [Porphyromonas sp. oral taxon 275]|uniref:4-alpha-glucanotransferase n=1 Tax=Porphyromonas sp. oral taxon 275 TaxID=712435 RepID=UPI001BA98762|nr:4-alpha-glucanotransferase [Porphyromonas sp. oral taxon 275]QUB42334.1 4-alpha-glucanotransferase [Porphyromonas sp. oral taxon 275]